MTRRRLTDEELDTLRHYFSRGAYSYSFEPTGDADIDLVLGAVCLAGKWSHHTESWGESPSEGQKSPLDYIQAAANRAAESRLRLSAEDLEALRDFRDSRFIVKSEYEDYYDDRDPPSRHSRAVPVPLVERALAILDRLIGTERAK